VLSYTFRSKRRTIFDAETLRATFTKKYVNALLDNKELKYSGANIRNNGLFLDWYP